MPTYDYRCAENDRVVEVSHKMNDSVSTWGALCNLAGIEPGDTDAGAPVERLATGGNVVRSSSLKSQAPAGCTPGACSNPMGCSFAD